MGKKGVNRAKIKMAMTFEGFQDLMRRIARNWYERAKAEIIEMNIVNNYLKESPFVAKQTPDNELAYEKLMDIRLKVVDLSYEIDRNHDAYMRFMGTTLNSMDLKNKICKPLKLEERNLVDLELMIMEQVQDWELDVGKTTAESNWDKVQDMIVTLPDDTTSTIRISAEPQRRSWFGFCPISMKIGSLKMCGGCKLVGYFSKEDQKADWNEHKVVCKAVTGLMKSLGVKHVCEKLSGDRLVEAMSRALGRDLKQDEMDLCHYPRVCGLCGQGGSQQDALRNCTRCHCIAWCPDCIEKGKEGHEEWCHLLKTSLEDCGFKFYPSWDASIPSLVPESGAPCVFTEFTLNDTKDNLAKVERLVKNIDVTMPCRRNPFCSRRPVRCSDKSGNYVK